MSSTAFWRRVLFVVLLSLGLTTLCARTGASAERSDVKGRWSRRIITVLSVIPINATSPMEAALSTGEEGREARAHGRVVLMGHRERSGQPRSATAATNDEGSTSVAGGVLRAMIARPTEFTTRLHFVATNSGGEASDCRRARRESSEVWSIKLTRKRWMF